MKKNYYLFLLMIPFAVFALLSNAGGKTGGYSGSPGDGFTTCSDCHSGGDFGAVASISTTIPAAGYEYGVTYEVSVSVTSSSTRHGFQLTAEDAANAKVGSYTAGSNNQVVNGGTHVTHTAGGVGDTVWTFEWTAPSAAVEGNEVTFYAAVNATNANGGTSGDQVVTTSETYMLNDLNVADNNLLEMSIYPNPAVDVVNVNIDNYQDAQVQITDLTGKIVLTQVLNSKEVNISHLNSGLYMLNVLSGNLQANTKLLKR